MSRQITWVSNTLTVRQILQINILTTFILSHRKKCIDLCFQELKVNYFPEGFY